MTVTITLLYKGSSATATVQSLKLVHLLQLQVELVYLIFCQHLVELFSSQMGGYVHVKSSF